MSAETSVALEAAVLSAGATFFTAMIGVGVVVWQMRRQAKNSIEQNNHSKILETKFRLYEELLSICRTASDENRELTSYVSKFRNDVATYKDLTSSGIAWPVPAARGPETIELRYRASRKLIEIIGFTERWLTVDPRMDLIQIAVNVINEDIESAFKKYFDTVVRMMPVQEEALNQGALLPWTPPDDADTDVLEERTNELVDRLFDVDTLIIDILNEMQNVLVGELFNTSVSPRNPLDPSIKVMRFDRYEELMEFYKTQTEWGRRASQADESVRSRLNTNQL